MNQVIKNTFDSQDFKDQLYALLTYKYNLSIKSRVLIIDNYYLVFIERHIFSDPPLIVFKIYKDHLIYGEGGLNWYRNKVLDKTVKLAEAISKDIGEILDNSAYFSCPVDEVSKENEKQYNINKYKNIYCKPKEKKTHRFNFKALILLALIVIFAPWWVGLTVITSSIYMSVKGRK